MVDGRQDDIWITSFIITATKEELCELLDFAIKNINDDLLIIQLKNKIASK